MKKIIPVIVFLFISSFIFSQTDDNEYSDDEEVTEFETIKDDKKSIDWSKVRLGGDIAFSFNGAALFAEFSPLIGYQIIEDRLEFGPGLIYQHISEANKYSINNVGGQAYVRGYIYDGFYAQVDGFLVNFNIKYTNVNRKSSFTYGNGFVGAGYALNHIDNSFYMTISVKTNILTDQFYPTRQFLPKIGFQFKM